MRLKHIVVILLAAGTLRAQTPGDGAGWFQLGQTRHTEGKFDDAITAFTKALEFQFRPPGSMLRIARAYSRKNDVPNALDWLEKSAAAGFGQPQGIESEADFAPLRPQPR